MDHIEPIASSEVTIQLDRQKQPVQALEILRCINRLNDLVEGAQVEGNILIDGLDIYDSTVDIIDLRKTIGIVFQKTNPFPKSIYDNVAYGPRISGIRNRGELDAIVEKSLKGGALWDEVKDRLPESALGILRRTAATPLHRTGYCSRARSHLSVLQI